MFGSAVAETIPVDGLIDVHRHVTVVLKGQRLFSGPARVSTVGSLPGALLKPGVVEATPVEALA
jgi:hypothetical protein